MEPGAGARLLELVEQHYTLLYRYGYRLTGTAADAEDLTQQTFLTAQSRLDQLRDPERAKAWLCTILRNHYLKERRHRNCIAIQSLETVAEPAFDARDIAVDSERLQQVLNELPEEFRTPLILFYFEEFTYKDIAEQMEVPVGTVMSRLSRAKAFLRSRLATPSSEALKANGTAAHAQPQWTA
jgi:RNA polymerase sigma-70 factor (ECF subfamily)